MDIPNRTEIIVARAFDLTVGKESSAWQKWWGKMSLDMEGVGIALYAALLSLGAPPAPEHLTKDLTDIELGMLPPKHPTGVKPENRDEWDMHRARAEARLDRRWRQQLPYNKRLNVWAKNNGLVFRHKTQDPAQFRKLFAGFLHACKGEDK